MADTIMVNHIRTVTLTMVKPLIEISREQLADVQQIDEKLKIVNDRIKEEAELLKKPKVPQVGMFKNPLFGSNSTLAGFCPNLKKRFFFRLFLNRSHLTIQ